MELSREQVYLDQTVGNEQQQLMLEGEILIPDAKPDMQLILQTESRMTIERADIAAERIHFSGRMALSVLYLAKSGDKTVHAISHSHNVEDFINLEGIDKDMFARLDAEIVNIEFRMVNDRKVSWRAVANVRAYAERSDAHPMVIHIHDVPENQLLKSPLPVNRTIEHRTERFSVAEQIILPGGKPNVQEVLLVTAAISGCEERMANGRVTLAGELLVTALYRGDTDGRIEFLESTVPFSGAFDVSGAREDMLADVSLQVLEHNARTIADDDGEDRVIDIEISLGAQIKVYATETLSVLQDAYCTRRQLHISKTNVLVPRLLCHNRNQTPVKEIVELSGNAPDMLQVFRVRGVAHLDDVKVLDDKVVVEGAITTDILYVAQSDSQPLGAYSTVIPFRQVIEAKGATPTMRVSVATSIDQATFNMLSPRETEVRFQLTFNTRIIEERDASIVNDITATEPDPTAHDANPSMTIYIVQPADTPWSVAKRFNTPLDELLETNDLETGAVLTVGQKLLLVK